MSFDTCISLGENKQGCHYLVLPKGKNGKIVVSLPAVIYDDISKWILSKEAKKLTIENMSVAYTVYGATVELDTVGLNRYGSDSHNLTVKFDNMTTNFKRD